MRNLGKIVSVKKLFLLLVLPLTLCSFYLSNSIVNFALGFQFPQSPNLMVGENSLSFSSLPSPADPITLIAQSTMANYLTRMLLPISVEITPDLAPNVAPVKITIVDMKYCGAENSNKATILAIAHPEGIPDKPPAPFLMSSHCSLSLDEVAQQVVQTTELPDWVVVAKLSAQYADGQIKFAIVSAVTKNKSGRANTAPENLANALINSKDLLPAFKTSDIQATLKDDKKLSYTAVPSFASESITIYFIPTEQAKDWQTPTVDCGSCDEHCGTFDAVCKARKASCEINRNKCLTEKVRDFKDDMGTSKVLVIVPHTAENFLINSYYGSEPIRISSGSGDLLIRNAKATGGENSYSLNGQVTRSTSPVPTLDTTFEWKGANDLVIDNVKVVCSGLPRLLCNPIETTVKNGLLANLNKNPKLRPFYSQKLFSITINNKKYNLRPTIDRIKSDATSSYTFGTFQLETP